MIYNSGLLQVSGALQVTTGAPVDCRYIVEKSASLASGTFLNTFKFGDTFTFYEGMLVYAQDTQKIYILKYTRDDAGKITLRNFEELKTGSDINESDIVDIISKLGLIDTATLLEKLNIYYNDTIKPNLTNLYKIKGVVDDVEYLPKDPSVGDVYNVRNRFTIEIEVNGEKQVRTYPAGTNVVWITYDVLVERQKTHPETGAPLFEADGTTPLTEQVKETRTHWDALGGISEFDWIDLTAEPELPTA